MKLPSWKEEHETDGERGRAGDTKRSGAGLGRLRAFVRPLAFTLGDQDGVEPRRLKLGILRVILAFGWKKSQLGIADKPGGTSVG